MLTDEQARDAVIVALLIAQEKAGLWKASLIFAGHASLG